MAASAVETVAGVSIAISASAPATFDSAGYTALTFTTIGEVTDGGEHGRTYATVNHQPLDKRGVQKLKGSFNEGTKNLALAISPADAGQVLAKAALTSDASYYFKVTYQGGDIDYFPAKVMSFVKKIGTIDNVRAATMGLEITTSATGVGLVEKLAV